MVKLLSRGRQVKARALGSSAMLLTVMVASPAFAQCTPDPTQSNTTTTCTGTDSNGLVVTTSGTTVDVASGATVTNSGASAIAFPIPTSLTSYPSATLTVGGLVDGGTQTGVQFVRQATTNGYTTGQLSVTVGAGGRISGANGLVIGQSGSSFGNTVASIDNSGTISGTGSGTGTGTNGYALLSTSFASAGFSTITNRAGGRIGAIGGPVGTLTNAGTIDGGTRSAIDMGTSYSSAVYGYNWTNSGTIQSNSTGATLAGVRSITLVNSGTIANSGTGAAITATGATITNAAGGRIATAGATAIQADGNLYLTNAGTIVGDVVITAANFGSSNVDNSSGTITGNLRFGTTSDTLTVGYANGAIRTGVSGTIDGGSGTDTLRVRFTSDATLASAVVLPTGFEQLSLAPDADKTATLASGFTTVGPITIDGTGTVVNRVALTGTGTVVRDTLGSGLGAPSFVNAGTGERMVENVRSHDCHPRRWPSLLLRWPRDQRSH